MYSYKPITMTVLSANTIGMANGKVPMEPWLFAGLLASAIFSVLWYGPLTLLKAANRHLRATIVLAIASAGDVAVAALLLTWTGKLASAGLALLLTRSTTEELPPASTPTTAAVNQTTVAPETLATLLLSVFLILLKQEMFPFFKR